MHLIRNLAITFVALVVIAFAFILINQKKEDSGDTQTIVVPTSDSCTSYSYSDWSACVSGKQTRTIISTNPKNCIGNDAVLSQVCSTTTPQPLPPTVGTTSGASTTLKLPINFYCYSFEAESSLNCTKNESQIKSELVEVNRIWKQADIEWVLNSFSSKHITAGEFDLNGKETAQQIKTKLSLVGPQDSPANIWNVVLFQYFPPPTNAAGLYLPNIHTVFYAETKKTRNGSLGDVQSYVLAHELGHSLTLGHTDPNSDPDNLMGPGAITASLPSLTKEQIAIVKARAVKGPAGPADMSAYTN